MSQQQGGGGGRDCGRGPPNPQDPQQGGRGGYQRGRGRYQQGRGFKPQQPQQGGRGGGHFQQSRGSFPQQPQHGGRGGGVQQGQHVGYQGCGGMLPQQQFAPVPDQGRGGHRGNPFAGGPSRTPVSELHQATHPSYQATLSQDSLSSHPLEISQVAEQFQQMSVQGEAGQTSQVAIPASDKSMKYPLHPGKGTFGDRCIVKANHFFAELPKKDLYHYNVAMMPDITSRGLFHAVMGQLVRLYRESHLVSRLPAYDGRKSLYTAGELPFTEHEFRITLNNEGDGPNGQR